MIKQDLINEISQSTGVDKKVCRCIIDETISSIGKSLSSGESIYLRGLFTLRPVLRAKKKARIISKKKPIIVPEHYAPHATFSASIIKKMKKLPVK